MLLLTWILALLLPAPIAPRTGVATHVVISGVRPKQGPVVVRFYNRPDQFLQTVYRQYTQQAEGGTLTVTADLPAGTYAVAAFQDLDGSGELNLNWFRIPTEPVGFGNNFRPRMAKPTFAECAITVTEGHATFAITLY